MDQLGHDFLLVWGFWTGNGSGGRGVENVDWLVDFVIYIK